MAARSHNKRCNPHPHISCNRVDLTKELSPIPYDICQQNTVDTDTILHNQDSESGFMDKSGLQIFDDFDIILDETPTKIPS